MPHRQLLKDLNPEEIAYWFGQANMIQLRKVQQELAKEGIEFSIGLITGEVEVVGFADK